VNKFDLKHQGFVNKYGRDIEKLYEQLIKEAAKIGVTLEIDPDKPFSFKDYPRANVRMNKLLKKFEKDLQAYIENGIKRQWELSNEKNNAMVAAYFGQQLTDELKRKYFTNNEQALNAFLQRKQAGLGLSDRIWNYSNMYKAELELGIGISKGTSAAEIARELKQYLKNPDKLFRRVRDEQGNLQLSKAAKAYNPGQGVYRSSFKNAWRTARSETNMAYRTNDFLRWKDMDFILGIEIRLSARHPHYDICDELVGLYPKEFKYTGWHPQCFCFATPILQAYTEFLKDQELLDENLKPLLKGKITDVPDNFKKWVADNRERIERAYDRGKVPYFIRDNEKYVNTVLGEMPIKTTHIKIESAYQKITEKVIDVENKIRMNKEFETAVVFDKNGNIVIDKRGSATNVSFSKDEMNLMKDCIFTHNHPRGWRYDENSMFRIGSSFSREDLKFAINSDVKEIRAVTPNYTFSLKRPDSGWGIQDYTLDTWYRRIEQIIRDDHDDRIMMGTLTEGQAGITLYHNITKLMATKFGWDYSKGKTF